MYIENDFTSQVEVQEVSNDTVPVVTRLHDVQGRFARAAWTPTSIWRIRGRPGQPKTHSMYTVICTVQEVRHLGSRNTEKPIACAYP